MVTVILMQKWKTYMIISNLYIATKHNKLNKSNTAFTVAESIK